MFMVKIQKKTLAGGNFSVMPTKAPRGVCCRNVLITMRYPNVLDVSLTEHVDVAEQGIL